MNRTAHPTPLLSIPLAYSPHYNACAYANLNVKSSIKDKESVTVSGNVSNTGKLASEETLQRYLKEHLKDMVLPTHDKDLFSNEPFG
ncbi:hypothetical protein [Pedobacter ureilyticus]|uniref:Uncharacterized protein n=1 Tax=Pedobacter ureilyticus TaxID=1393051 RepID=A0ABW9J8N8_9SPHI|nr:hypothetical protein [Pedobacter helvus]